MGNYVLCSTPVRSHLAPMLTIAGHLHERGHRVRFLTGGLFTDAVRGIGVEHVALPPECDYDDSDLDAAFPGRVDRKGLDRMRFECNHIFLDAIPHQRRALDDLIDQEGPDAILIDPGYAGALPLLMGPPTERPPILKAGITPLMFSSRDTAPFGLARSPSTNPLRRVRNKLLYRVGRRMFRSNEQYADQLLRREGCAAPDLPLFDWSLFADRFLQFSIPQLDYPRTDLPPHVSFVGPLPAQPDPAFQPPVWWNEDIVNTSKPVVYVTQGTVDNGDLGRLIGPTLQGLADLDVLVVATTGGRDETAIPATIPPNTRIAGYLPHAELLPRVAVMITNGGFGGVQHALARGIPLVVGGDTEDKPEVAARVAWAGAGIDLRTATPKPQQIRRAVEKVLADNRYRTAAGQLATKMAATSALTATEDALATCTPIDFTAGPAIPSALATH